MKRLCIVGVGLIGGSIGLAVKARNLPYHVVGIETNADTWGDALRVGAVDEITNDLAMGVRGADLVILAVPVGAVLELLPKLAGLIGENAVVTDVGSVKTAITDVGGKYLGARFVPGHPMAGRETGGVLNARADLFEGATWTITPDAFSRLPAQTTVHKTESVHTVDALIRALGAVPTFLYANAHDETVALTSHLPHVLAYALCSVALTRHETATPNLSAGSWRDVTRVAASPPDLWAGIATQNAAPLSDAIRGLITELSIVADALDAGDTDAVRERFAAGFAAKTP